MLRQQLEHHWPAHVLGGVALTYAVALIFFTTTMLGFADRTLDLSVERSTPASDAIVYSDSGPAQAVAEEIAQLDEVESVFVDSFRLAEVLTDTDHLTVTVRSLAPPALRTQALLKGAFPAASREIAITAKLGRALNLEVGQELTVVGDDVATRYTISGIYARSPILDQSGYEAIVSEPAPFFVATQGNDQGGIEVRAAPTASADDLQDAILAIPGTVVVSAQERYDAEYARQAAVLDQVTVAGPWLLTTAFLAATTVVFMTALGVARRRSLEDRTLRALGQSTPERHIKLAREIGVVAALAYLVGTSVGYAGAVGISSIIRADESTVFLPGHIGFPAQAAFWSFVAVALATTIGSTLGTVVISLRGTASWRPTIATATPAIVVFSAAFLYATIAMPGALDDQPTVWAVVGSLLLLAALFVVAYAAACAVARVAGRLLRVDSNFTLFPRSLTGMAATVAMFAILISSAALGALHTAYSTLHEEADRNTSFYDLSMTSSPAAPSLAQKDLDAIAEWGSAKSTLTLYLLNTSDWQDENFQPGAIYAVDPKQAQDYFGRRLDLDKLLVPSGTTDIPDSVTITYTDDSETGRIADVEVALANIPFALISKEGLGELAPDAVWMRLTDYSLHHISEEYSRLDSALGSGEDRPVLTLTHTTRDDNPPSPSKIGSIVQTSVIIILAFVAFGRVPHHLEEQARETRYLQAKGMSFAAIQRRRLVHVLFSTLVMAVVGVALGVGSTYAFMCIHGWVAPPALNVPLFALALNLASIMLACLTFGILGYHTYVSKHTKPPKYAGIGR